MGGDEALRRFPEVTRKVGGLRPDQVRHDEAPAVGGRVREHVQDFGVRLPRVSGFAEPGRVLQSEFVRIAEAGT